MNEAAFSLKDFPDFSAAVRAKWAVVYLEPILGSEERLAVGVAVAVDDGGVVIPANQLVRLDCLYGAAGEHVRFIAEVGLEALSEDLTERGLSALTQPDLAFAGMRLGSLRDGAGENLEAIARTWLPVVSSLHDGDASQDLLSSTVEARSGNASGDPIPAIIAKKVSDIRPGLANFFRSEIRPNIKKAKRIKSIKPMIDYSGALLCANLCSLPLQRIFARGQEIKCKMFDLIVDRDQLAGDRDEPRLPYNGRSHQLIMFKPPIDVLATNERAGKEISEVIDDLHDLAITEKLGFRVSDSVDEIAQYMVDAEAKPEIKISDIN